MTLFDCCNLNTKNTNYWPSDIDPDMDYKDIAVELNKKIENYNFPKQFNLKLKTFFGGYSIILVPFSEKDEKEILIKLARSKNEKNISNLAEKCKTSFKAKTNSIRY